MKKRKHLIRLIILAIIGIYLIYQFNQMKFLNFIGYEMLLGIGFVIGFIFWLWASLKDIKEYQSTPKKRFLIAPILGLIFWGLIFGIQWKNNSEFNKPTLLRVYYDGDFNGTSIDFKTDGTYLFENFSIGYSTYIYGNYKLNGAFITLDKKEIDNVIKTNLLEIKDLEDGFDYVAGKYLIQIKANGQEIARATQFRIVKDLRK